MPIFNSAPIHGTPEEYRDYVFSTIRPDVICAVPKNNFDRVDYVKLKEGLAEFAMLKAQQEAEEILFGRQK